VDIDKKYYSSKIIGSLPISLANYTFSQLIAACIAKVAITPDFFVSIFGEECDPRF